MLYISRYGPTKTYGVVDTDDDVETIISREELDRATDILGLDIKGVHYVASDSSENLMKVIDIYQDPRYLTTRMIKLNSLCGVDVKVYRNEVVSVVANDSITPDMTRVRLSDYGREFSCVGSPEWGDYFDGTKTLVVVLDDLIDIPEWRLRVRSRGICWDICEVSDGPLVHCIYDYLIRHVSIDMWGEIVLDSGERFRFWKYCGVVSSSLDKALKYSGELATIEDKVEIGERVGRYYEASFRVLSEMDISVRWYEHLDVEFLKNILVSCKLYHVGSYIGCTDFEKLRSDMIGVFQYLTIATTASQLLLRQFENYIRFFEVPEWAQAYFIRLCNNAACAILKKMEQVG